MKRSAEAAVSLKRSRCQLHLPQSRIRGAEECRLAGEWTCLLSAIPVRAPGQATEAAYEK